MSTKFIKIFLSVVFFAASVHFAYAQVLGAAITIDTSPRSPAPGDTVDITATSYSTDLNQATFTWSVNGVTKKEGKGATTFELTAPGLGATTNVDITIDTKDIGIVTQHVLIAPASVDIIANANSYTPPFYKGKALPSIQGNVTLVALPNLITSEGRRLPASEVVFTWKKNGYVLGSLSGLGRNTLTIQEPYLGERPIQIDIDASSPENSLHAKGTYVAQASAPQILFYESNPLLGVNFNKAILSPYTLSSNEFTLFAAPYFFNDNIVKDYGSSFSWTINGTDVSPTESARNMLTLRSPGGAGTSIVSLSVKNNATIFQNAQTTLNVNYRDTGNGSVHF